MATARKNLGQAVPAVINTDLDLYTVPAATDTVISGLVIANTTAAAVTAIVKHRVAGAVSALKQQTAPTITIPANDYVVVMQGATLAATDVLTIQATSVSVTFNLYGQENT